MTQEQTALTQLDWSQVDISWRANLDDFFLSPQGIALKKKLFDAIASDVTVYPPRPFRALELTPLSEVKVVILGQDPYHGVGQAQGLAFSVAKGLKSPPSLRNIYKELEREGVLFSAGGGSLVPWATSGVLLLNAILTVEKDRAASHRNWGWEVLTDSLIRQVSDSVPHAVFLLWGNFAQSKAPLIDQERHLILTANHPSPLSANRAPTPFIGCGHFTKANAFLVQKGIEPIRW